MLQIFASVIDYRPVRIAMALVGVVLTLLFVPALIAGLVGGGSDLGREFPFFVVALFDFAGVVSAWLRIFMSSVRLAARPRLRWALAGGLTLGVLVAFWLALGFRHQSATPVSLAYAISAVLGVLLLVGTVFLPRRSLTIHPSGRRSGAA